MQKKHTSIRLPESIIESISEQAKKEHRTFSNMLEALLIRQLKKENEK